MRITLIEARDLPEAWFMCLKKLMGGLDAGGCRGTHQYKIDHGSYIGQTRLEFDFVTAHILNPGSKPIIPDVPQGVPPPTTMDYVLEYLPYLMANAPKKKNEQYTYGEFLEPQIPKVIEMYKKFGPGNNQAYMTIGDKYSIDQESPPCLRGIDTRIQDGKLHFMVTFRSWDLWAGWPSNMAAIQLLKEYMASEIGVEDGELIATSKGCHLYEYSWPFARTVLGG